jgi:hypothetical protein
VCLVRRLGKVERVVWRKGVRSVFARDGEGFARSCWRLADARFDCSGRNYLWLCSILRSKARCCVPLPCVCFSLL